MRAFQTLYLAVLLAVVSVTNAALVDDILDAITGAATCAACHSFLVPLKVLAAFGDKPFTNTLKVICKALNVCIPYVLGSYSILTCAGRRRRHL